jgi:hypothetical protein
LVGGEINQIVLPRLAAIGARLNASAPAELAYEDPNTAARRHMVLGAARAAYLQIRAGHNPFDWLYRLQEFSDFWMGDWPELTNLIGRLTIEADISGMPD